MSRRKTVVTDSPRTSMRVLASENLEVISPVFLDAKNVIGSFAMYPRYFRTIDRDRELLRERSIRC